MEESGGNWLLMVHTENLNTHSRQLVGGDPRQVSKNVVYCVYHQSGRSVATNYYFSGDLVIIHFLTGHILVALQHRYDGKWDGNGRASQCWGSATFKFWMGGAGLPFLSSKPLMCLMSALVQDSFYNLQLLDRT